MLLVFLLSFISTEPASQPSSAEIAKEAAKEASPTPILPSPKDPSKPAYQLYAEIDLPALGIGLVLSMARLVITQPAYCAPRCDPATLNALDRVTAGFHDDNWALATDIGLGVMIAAPALFLALDEGILPALNDLVVIGESAMLATSLASLATLALGRPRPMLYGDKAPLEDRNGANAGLSFLSSHAAVAFAIGMSTYMTSRRLHPNKMWAIPLATAVLGLGTAVFIAAGRVMAGAHFITDVTGGAIIGTAVGVLVPALHKAPIQVVPQVTKQSGGVMMWTHATGRISKNANISARKVTMTSSTFFVASSVDAASPLTRLSSAKC